MRESSCATGYANQAQNFPAASPSASRPGQAFVLVIDRRRMKKIQKFNAPAQARQCSKCLRTKRARRSILHAGEIATSESLFTR